MIDEPCQILIIANNPNNHLNLLAREGKGMVILNLKSAQKIIWINTKKYLLSCQILVTNEKK